MYDNRFLSDKGNIFCRYRKECHQNSTHRLRRDNLDVGIDLEALFHAVVYGRFIPDGVGLERGETFQVGT